MANTRDVMGDAACLDALVEDTLTSFEDDGITKVGNYGFGYRKSLTDVTLPNATGVEENGFSYCSALRIVDAPNVTTLGKSSFYGCDALETVLLGSVNTIPESAFNSCRKLREVACGKPYVISKAAFSSCSSMVAKAIDLSEVTNCGNQCFEHSAMGAIVLPKCSSFGNQLFSGAMTSIVELYGISSLGSIITGAGYLCHLVLRGESGVVTKTTSSLNYTPLAKGLGWIYVPDALLDDYKESSSWSAMAQQIVGISEYPKAMQDETISDPWSTIVASSSYATDYPLGSVKYLDVGGTQVAMVLVATDSDDLVSGGKARMTWISRDCLLNQAMNSTPSTEGGWGSCYPRSWLRTVIYPEIDPIVKTSIKEVTKTYCLYDGRTESIVDTVWIPSYRELSNSNSESSGCRYTTFFNTDSKRAKTRGFGGISTQWWLRSAYDGRQYRTVQNDGSISYTTTSNYLGICLGFCI